jgi:hypothetical protein
MLSRRQLQALIGRRGSFSAFVDQLFVLGLQTVKGTCGVGVTNLQAAA